MCRAFEHSLEVVSCKHGRRLSARCASMPPCLQAGQQHQQLSGPVAAGWHQQHAGVRQVRGPAPCRATLDDDEFKDVLAKLDEMVRACLLRWPLCVRLGGVECERGWGEAREG